MGDDEGNLGYEGGKLVKRRLGMEKGVWIVIRKRIAVGGGLGGGRSDGGGGVGGLNGLWKLKVRLDEVGEVGGEIG